MEAKESSKNNNERKTSKRQELQKKQELQRYKKQLRQKLCESIKNGTVLYLDGTISSPSRIIEAVVREEHNYMADFVTDDRGYIKEIRYDSIRL